MLHRYYSAARAVLARLTMAIEAGIATQIRYAVAIRHTLPVITRAERAMAARWPQTVARCRSILSNYVRKGPIKVQQSMMLARGGHVQKGADKLSEVISEMLTRDFSGLPTAIDEIVEAIDVIACNDGRAVEGVRALLRQVLFGSATNASPTSSTLSSGVKLAYISNSPMPSPAANCVHILKMCSALRRYGAEVTLFAEGSLDELPLAREALFRDFDVSDAFDYVRVEFRKTLYRNEF